MHADSFDEFLASADTLRVYKGQQLVFQSTKDRLLPLLEYIDRLAVHHQPVIIFDKITGNAAALLSIKAGCREVYSPLGSQLAIKTLESYHVKHHLLEIVEYIQQANGEDMCPMEKLSLGKNPEEFYLTMKDILAKSSKRTPDEKEELWTR